MWGRRFSLPRPRPRSGAVHLIGLVCVGKASPEPRQSLTQYCVACHNDSRNTAGISFQNLEPADLAAAASVWEKVLRKLQSGEMPPPGLPRAGCTQWLAASLDKAAAAHPYPARQPPHRLSRTEYGSAVRDLLGIEVDAEKLLPPDDPALSFSSSLMERYLGAAARRAGLASPPRVPQKKRTAPAPPSQNWHGAPTAVPLPMPTLDRCSAWRSGASFPTPPFWSARLRACWRIRARIS